MGDLIQGKQPQILRGIGVWWMIEQKTCNISKGGKIGPRLLLMTNRKLHTHFRLVPKSTSLGDLQWPLRTLFQNAYLFGTHHEHLNGDRLMVSAAKMCPMTLVSGNIRFIRIFAEVPWRGSAKRQWSNRECPFSVISDAISLNIKK